jgi:hypothetical protein
MAKSYVSPGVFANEIDASFLGQAVSDIGGAFIGTTQQGPAFVPVTVTTFDEFKEIFGGLDEDHKMAYAAKAYLKNAPVLNVVRVLGASGMTDNTGATITPGYTAQSVWGVIAVSGSNVVANPSDAYLMATLELSSAYQFIVNDLSDDLFDLRVSGSSGYVVSTTASFLTSSDYYVKKVLNTDPTTFTTAGYYLRDVFDYNLLKLGRSSTGTPGAAVYTSASLSTMTAFTFGHMSASTPWIKSQLFGGATEYNLFRVHTKGHGEAENGRFKLSIRDVKLSPVPAVNPYGTFTLELRDFDDGDTSPVVVESFTNLSLNPADRNYILKQIGNQYLEYDNSSTMKKMVLRGDYESKSRFVWIEMTTGSLPAEALPWGFRGLSKPNLSLASGSVTSSFSQIPYVDGLRDKTTDANYDERFYWGVEFSLSGSVKGRLSRYPTMTGSDVDFSLRLVSGSSLNSFDYNSANPTTSQKVPGDANSHTVLEPDYAKFTVPFAGGFDGWDRRVELPLDNDTQLTAQTQIGVQALRQAVDVVRDPDFIDINLLAIPGVYSDQVVEYALSKVENRGDAFYVMDISGSTVSQVVSEVKSRGFNSNYAGVYYPGAKVVDNDNGGQIVTVPASVLAVGAIAYNDRVAFPWFAPAGLNRGGLNVDTIGFNIAAPTDFLTRENKDTLYDNRINPVAQFPGVTGLTIWGQKTLQVKASALDRINVRRLMIKAKKLIASATRFLVFEPNNASTYTRFKSIVNPILQDIQLKNGLELFQVVMDSSTNTPDLIDRNIMKGVIKLVPTRSAEFIVVDFVINRSGASFEE